MKFRTIGLAQQIYEGMGATVDGTARARDRARARARRAGRGRVQQPDRRQAQRHGRRRARSYMVGSYHQQSEYLEWLFNKPKFDGLPKDVQAMIKYAVMAQNSRLRLAEPGSPQPGLLGDAAVGEREGLPHAGRGARCAARHLGPDRPARVGRRPVLRQGRAVAAGVGQPRRANASDRWPATRSTSLSAKKWVKPRSAERD